MRVVVTGGAGFIGSHVVDRLCENGHNPVVFDALLPAVHPSGKWPEYLRHDVEKVRGDVRDGDAIAQALIGADVVLHLAAAVGVGESAYKVDHYVSCNTHGTAVLLEQVIAMKNRPEHVLVAGSMSSYGEGSYINNNGVLFNDVTPRTERQMQARNWEFSGLSPTGTTEAKPFDIRSVYAQTKRDQEDLALTVGEQHDIDVTVPRFFNVYGERQALSNPYTGVAAIFSSMIANGTPPRVYEDGNQSRDFIHVSDVARAVVELGVGPCGGVGAINIGTGRPTTINQLAAALLRMYGRTDLGVDVRHQYRVGDIRHCFANTDKLDEVLGGWDTVPLAAGLEQLASWASEQPSDDRSLTAHQELLKRGLLR